MPMLINRSSETTLTDIFDEDFFNQLKSYLGYDPDTPIDDIPVNMEELLQHAISQCEQEQWRFILPKEVTLYLPSSVFCDEDKLIILPFGPIVDNIDSGVDSITTFTYIDINDTVQSIVASAYRRYLGEPIRLWCNNWGTLTPNIKTEDPYPVTITYTAGYATFNDIPHSTIRALKILCYHFDSFREAIAESSVVIPAAYCHNRDFALLNDRRAIRYIVDDWSKVNSK